MKKEEWKRNSTPEFEMNIALVLRNNDRVILKDNTVISSVITSYRKSTKGLEHEITEWYDCAHVFKLEQTKNTFFQYELHVKNLYWIRFY